METEKVIYTHDIQEYMEEIKKGDFTPKKAEECKEETGALIKRDYDKLDSIYTRIVNASDDLEVLVKELSGKGGSIAMWYILSNAKEEMELSIKGIGKILCGEVT